MLNISDLRKRQLINLNRQVFLQSLMEEEIAIAVSFSITKLAVYPETVDNDAKGMSARMRDKKVLSEGVAPLRGEERAVFLPIKRKK